MASSSMPDARDNRISELEQMVEDLKDTIGRQRDTIDALQKTNQLLTEQLEETSKQLESSNEQFITSRGLLSSGGNGSDNNLQRSLSIDETGALRKDSMMSQSSESGLYCNAPQSIQVDEDDVYSSGDDIETYKTKITDDHELLPIKQGTLKKKSENMHRYNSRYVVLYPSFLLYYDQCPIKIENARKRKNSSFSSKSTANNAINHPKGTVYLRNYHVSIRKDIKKKRFDITFVPHKSAVSMGLAAVDARIRFRCKTMHELQDWTEKIRTAITSVNSGFIKYDIRMDYINNDLSNLGRVNETENDNNDDNKDGNDEDEENEDKGKTKMFDINDLKEMMKREEELRNELESIKRFVVKLEKEKEALKTDLTIKTTEIESEQRVSLRQKKDLEAKLEDVKEHENTLKEEMSSLRATISKLEQKQKDQHKKVKRYKHHEEDILKNIVIIQKWNKKLDECSLQYLGTIYPSSSNKQLFETCQRGCVCLLEETYKTFNKINGNISEREDDHDIHDSDYKEDKKGKKHKKKESKICKEMMLSFVHIFRRHIKTTINYASLQQAHNGVVEDLKILRKDFQDFENDDRNTLSDDALIMASMTASLF